MKNPTIHRRAFLKTTMATAAGITIIPSHVMGKALGHVAPSDKLNIAGIGIGGNTIPKFRWASSNAVVPTGKVPSNL